MPRRKDGTLVYNVPTYRKIFPFIMPKRCDSLVYMDLDLDLTEAILFIKNNPCEKLNRKYRVFELFIAAFIRTVVQRPELNRFVMNKKLWQRNELSINFVVKEDDDDDAPEHSIVAVFNPESTLEEIALIVDEEIEKCRLPINSNTTDKLIDFFTGIATPIATFLVSVLKVLDRKGLAPKSVMDADSLHSTAFISNLGSIGLNCSPVHHHLYDWGTTSIFITIGALKRNRNHTPGGVKFHDTLQIGVTLDERISDGYYFVHSLHVMQDILKNPSQLLSKPAEIQKRPPKNRKEMKKMKRGEAFIL